MCVCDWAGRVEGGQREGDGEGEGERGTRQCGWWRRVGWLVGRAGWRACGLANELSIEGAGVCACVLGGWVGVSRVVCRLVPKNGRRYGGDVRNVPDKSRGDRYNNRKRSNDCVCRKCDCVYLCVLCNAKVN